MLSLLSLPDEILCYISSQLHPSNLLNIVLVNKRLYHCSQSSILRQKRLLNEKRNFSNRHPLSVPCALRDVIHDPTSAWYTRDFEVWGIRNGFRDWKGWGLDRQRAREYWSEPEKDENCATAEELYDYTHLDSSFYTTSEIVSHRDLLSDVLLLDAKVADDWMEKLQSGHDEPLKALFLAQCPKLVKLTFMMYNALNNSDSLGHSPLHYLCHSIKRLQSANIPRLQWPAGFQSLQDVVIRKYTKYRHPRNAFSAIVRTIAPFLLLPNLRSLHVGRGVDLAAEDNIQDELDESFRGIGDDTRDEDNYDGRNSPRRLSRFSKDSHSADPATSFEKPDYNGPYIFEWGPKVSSLQRLSFEYCRLDIRTVKSFIQACKGLRQFCPSGGFLTEFETEIFEALTDQAASLEVLELFSPPRDTFRTIDPSLAQLRELVRLDIPLRHLVDYRDEKRNTLLSKGAAPAHLARSQRNNDGMQEISWLDLRKCLPPSLKMLRVKEGGQGRFSNSIEDAEGLIQAFIDLILGYPADEPRHTNLRHICIAEAPFTLPREGVINRNTTLKKFARETGSYCMACGEWYIVIG